MYGFGFALSRRRGPLPQCLPEASCKARERVRRPRGPFALPPPPDGPSARATLECGGGRALARCALAHGEHRASHSTSACVLKYVLYVDGPSDLALLRAPAERLGHPAADVWDDQANAFYLRDLRRVPGAAQSDLGAGTKPRSAVRQEQVRADARTTLPCSSPRRSQPERPRDPRHGVRVSPGGRGGWPADRLVVSGGGRTAPPPVRGPWHLRGHPVFQPAGDRPDRGRVAGCHLRRSSGWRSFSGRSRAGRAQPKRIRQGILPAPGGPDRGRDLLPPGDLHHMVRSMDKRDIPSEVSRVPDLLDTLFRRARRDQKCPSS